MRFVWLAYSLRHSMLRQKTVKPGAPCALPLKVHTHPYNFTKPDGTLDGMEIELYKVLCDNMKVKCEIMVQPFASSIPALNAGKFDAIISGMSTTPKRREVIDFSQP